jgi:hypothetical protein
MEKSNENLKLINIGVSIFPIKSKTGEIYSSLTIIENSLLTQFNKLTAEYIELTQAVNQAKKSTDELFLKLDEINEIIEKSVLSAD